jgi:ribosomal protein L15
MRGGKIQRVKVLGTGSLTKKLELSGITVSESAKAAIEKAGGSVL